MQVLQAGQHKIIFLELEPEMVGSIARQAGFETRVKDGQRQIQLDLHASSRQAPLLLFDASDPSNLGWFSRCQFYIDAQDGRRSPDAHLGGEQARPLRPHGTHRH